MHEHLGPSKGGNTFHQATNQTTTKSSFAHCFSQVLYYIFSQKQSEAYESLNRGTLSPELVQVSTVHRKRAA